jgi:tetratricopeptide (TPR) repeat protein
VKPPVRQTPSNPLQAFDRALQLHRQGQLDQAEQAYQAIAPTHPRYFDALHLRGLLRSQQGRYTDALAYIGAALKGRPTHAAAWSSLGDVQARLGRLDEALASYDRALALKPDYAEALNNRGNALRDLRRPDAALASYDKALGLKPDYVEALNNRGNALRDLRRPEEALASYDCALALKPDHPQILDNRGNALRDLGRPEEALASCDRALALKPDSAEAHYNRGNALRDLHRLEQALASYDRALAGRPDHADALYNRGNTLRELRRPEAALASYDRALVLRPGYIEAHNNRGNALRDLRRPEAALASYDQALALKPDHAEALYNRGIALGDLRRSDEALASYDRALELRPDYPEALNNRGTALRELGRAAEALASYDRALALKPDYAVAHDNRALTLTELGRFEEAEAAIGRAIELAPRRVRNYYDLTLLSGRWDADDPHLRAMEELAQDLPALGADEQIELHFALSKALESAGSPERAFQHLLDGNAVKRKQVRYDEPAALAAIDRIRASFTGEVMRDRAGRGMASPVPVFILGMPRSGTTLVEQILASHPLVFGAGEIEDLGQAISGLDGPASGMLQSPESISRASDADLRALGTAYLGRIAVLAPAAARITNKLPENFRLAGLIHLALPDARIIHTRRDPVDTCLSCFSQLFAGNLPYTYDLAELGRYYGAYAALMAHWQNVLPPEVLIEVQYEEVVADLEGQARRILGHCGLDWDARCLDFHRTERPVRTASMTQVRQPLYKSSVARWRRHEAHLGPLLDALGLKGTTRP